MKLKLLSSDKKAIKQLILTLNEVLKTLNYYSQHRKEGIQICKKCRSITIFNLGDNGKRAKEALRKIQDLLDK